MTNVEMKIQKVTQLLDTNDTSSPAELLSTLALLVYILQFYKTQLCIISLENSRIIYIGW